MILHTYWDYSHLDLTLHEHWPLDSGLQVTVQSWSILNREQEINPIPPKGSVKRIKNVFEAIMNSSETT